MEFSPHKIGMPKYGTFMQTEHFGSKFFCGKLVKYYKEPPLFYLQGKLERFSWTEKIHIQDMSKLKTQNYGEN